MIFALIVFLAAGIILTIFLPKLGLFAVAVLLIALGIFLLKA